MKQRSETRKARVLRGLALVSDIAHFVVVVPFMLFGQLLIGPQLHAMFIAVVIGLQLAFLHCPMVVFSSWLRSFSNEDGWERSIPNRGLVWWLYQKFGIWAAVPISVGLFATTILVHQAFAL